jgi:hypothetical protein
MVNLFKSLVRSIITYGSFVLLTANKKIWKHIQINQNKALTTALGLPVYTSTKYIHHSANTPKIKNYATFLLQQSITRANNYNDTISKNIYYIFWPLSIPIKLILLP